MSRQHIPELAGAADATDGLNASVGNSSVGGSSSGDRVGRDAAGWSGAPKSLSVSWTMLAQTDFVLSVACLLTRSCCLFSSLGHSSMPEANVQ